MCEDAASQSAVQLDAHLADRAAIYLQFLESEAASKVLRAARLTSLGSVFLAVQFARKFSFFEDSIAAPGELSAEEFLAQSLQLKPLDDLYLGYHRGKGGHLRYQAHLIKHSCVVHCAMAKIMNLLQEMKKVLKTTHALALEELLAWRKSREAVFANALPSQYFLGPLA